MDKKTTSEFRRGYDYASQVYSRLLAKSSLEEILELARFLEERDEGDEGAQGMGAYCRELAGQRK